MSKEVVMQHKALRNEIVIGMKSTPKSLPSKYFYDERGSELFDEITRLPEYYPTRTERKILTHRIDEIGKALGPEVELIEPGSGSSEKTRILLKHLKTIRCYVPIDISGAYLFKVADKLREEFPDIDIEPLTTDYTRPFILPETHPTARKVVFFPGSTIGNFKTTTIQRFFTVISNIIGPKGAVLIGVDLKKDREVLEAAYNDAAGITAAFNKNMLTHLNRKLGSDFDPENYTHNAVWVEEESRIEMRLIAQKNHLIHIDNEVFELQEGEYIHTENSHKYSLDEFAALVAPWFRVARVWTDEQQLFSLQYLIPNR